MASQRCTQHSNGGWCSVCGLCNRCHFDECDGEHPTNYKEVRKRRKGLAAPRSHLECRPSRTVVPSYNEALLATETTAAIQSLEKSENDDILAKLAGIVDEPIFSIALREKKLPIADLVANDRLRKSFVNGLHGLVRAVVKRVTDTDDAASVLVKDISEKLSNGSILGGGLLVKHLAQNFLMATNSVSRRAAFAHLVNAIPEKAELKEHLLVAQSDIMHDSTLLNELKPRKVRSYPSGGGTVQIHEHSVLGQLDSKVAWAISDTRRAQAVVDFSRLRRGLDLLADWSKVRVKSGDIQLALRNIENGSLGWKGGYTRNVSIGNEVKVFDLPVLNVANGFGTTYEDYCRSFDTGGSNVGRRPLGRDTFRFLFNSLCKPISEKHALSYYFTDMMDALNSLGEMIERMHSLYNEHSVPGSDPSTRAELDAIGCNLDEFKLAIKQSLEHCKYGIRQHSRVNDCDGNIHHCVNHSVGGNCSSSHDNVDCVPCHNLAALGHTAKLFMNAIANALGRQHEDQEIFGRKHDGGPVFEILSMAKPIRMCWRAIDLFHRHVFRGIYINAQVANVMSKLMPGQVLMVLDHKQKINPFAVYESSAEYYGKKGMSLLGIHIRWKVGEDLMSSHYIDCVSTSSKQDVKQVQTILALLVPHIKVIVQGVKEIILLSDNGPAFTGSEHLSFCRWMNAKSWNCDMRVIRWIFFEAQCGKTTLDTHFSFVGLLITRFARSVRAVKNPKDVYDALRSEDGIANSSALFIEFNDFSDKADDAEDKPVARGDDRVEGVRRLHDIQFQSDGQVVLFDYPGIEKGSRQQKFNTNNFTFEICASIKDRFCSSRVSQPTSTLKASERGNGPGIIHELDARPLHVALAQNLIEFATQARNSEVAALPLNTGLYTALESTVSSKKKVKVKVDGDNDDMVLKRASGWAGSENREVLPIPDELRREVVRLYQEGEKSGTRFSPATVSQKLRDLVAVRRNWTALYSCSESNVRKVFT